MAWNRVTEEIKQGICEMYKTNSMTDISKHFHICERRIRDILVKSGIEIHNSHKTTKKEGEWDYQIECQKRFPFHNGYHYVARSKDTGTTFLDYMNNSGTLINYIKKEYSVQIPSLFLRKKYFKENGKQWYEEYFDIVEVPDEVNETKKCPYCDWTTKDIKNLSGAFQNHLLYEHGKTKEEYLSEFPDDLEYFHFASSTKQLQYEKDESKFVCCAICGKKLKRIDWRHLLTHGIDQETYIKKYGNKTLSKDCAEKLRANAIETNKTMVFHNRSKAEIEIEEFIRENGVSVNGKRKIIDGNEIDIYLPDLKVGIEYNGIFYHTEEFGKDKNYHLNKTKVCKKNGIKLIQIFEDEYTLHKDIVLNKLLHLIGCHKSQPKIMARKCTIAEIKKEDARRFLDTYHIQGCSGASVYLGAYFNDKLIAVMTFRRESSSSDKWELIRFASDYHYVCQGVGGKLFKWFVRKYMPNEVKSFADRRWTINEENNLYIQLGFKLDKYTNPDYKYVGTGRFSHIRSHKFGFRKGRLLKMDKNSILNENMTEDEMRKALGYKRIWDCGLIKYVWSLLGKMR